MSTAASTLIGALAWLAAVPPYTECHTTCLIDTFIIGANVQANLTKDFANQTRTVLHHVNTQLKPLYIELVPGRGYEKKDEFLVDYLTESELKKVVVKGILGKRYGYSLTIIFTTPDLVSLFDYNTLGMKTRIKGKLMPGTITFLEGSFCTLHSSILAIHYPVVPSLWSDQPGKDKRDELVHEIIPMVLLNGLLKYFQLNWSLIKDSHIDTIRLINASQINRATLGNEGFNHRNNLDTELVQQIMSKWKKLGGCGMRFNRDYPLYKEPWFIIYLSTMVPLFVGVYVVGVIRQAYLIRLAKYRSALTLVTILSLVSCSSTHEILVHNCEIDSESQVIEIDLTHKPTCGLITKTYSPVASHPSTIVQLSPVQSVPVANCRLTIQLEISPCGTDGLYTRLWNRERVVHTELIHIEKEQCETMQKSKVLEILNYQGQYGTESGQHIILTNLGMEPRGTIILAGDTSINENYCRGANFILKGHHFRSHVLYLYYDSHIEDLQGLYYFEEQTLLIDGRIRINDINNGAAYDSTLGTFVYNATGLTRDYLEIASGPSRYYFNNEKNLTDIFILERKVGTISLMLLDKCEVEIGGRHIPAYETFLDGIFVLNMTAVKELDLRKADEEDISLLAEIRGEFKGMLLQQNLQLDQAFTQTARAFCEIKKALLQSNPRKVASELLTRNDFRVKSALLAGSILYVVRCKPMKVFLDPIGKADQCFQDAPVYYMKGNKSVKGFVDGLQGIFKYDSEVVPCNIITPSKFKFQIGDGQSKWFCYVGSRLVEDEFCVAPAVTLDLNTQRLYNFSARLLDITLYEPSLVKKLNSKFLTHARSLDGDQPLVYGKYITLSSIFRENYPLRGIISQSPLLKNIRQEIENSVKNNVLYKIITFLSNLKSSLLDFMIIVFIVSIFLRFLELYKYKEEMTAIELTLTFLRAIMNLDRYQANKSPPKPIIKRRSIKCLCSNSIDNTNFY